MDRAIHDDYVLVLQGGGALGAYQAGVFEALAAEGIEPNWVTGISIGAVAYLPQVVHLAREHCSAGISSRAWAMWLASAVLVQDLVGAKHVGGRPHLTAAKAILRDTEQHEQVLHEADGGALGEDGQNVKAELGGEFEPGKDQDLSEQAPELS